MEGKKRGFHRCGGRRAIQGGWEEQVSPHPMLRFHTTGSLRKIVRDVVGSVLGSAWINPEDDTKDRMDGSKIDDP